MSSSSAWWRSCLNGLGAWWVIIVAACIHTATGKPVESVCQKVHWVIWFSLTIGFIRHKVQSNILAILTKHMPPNASWITCTFYTDYPVHIRFLTWSFWDIKRCFLRLFPAFCGDHGSDGRPGGDHRAVYTATPWDPARRPECGSNHRRPRPVS